MNNSDNKVPEFWKILKTPPKKTKSYEELHEMWANELQKEIDKEIIESLVKLAAARG